MKKQLLTLLTLGFILSGCGQNPSTSEKGSEANPDSISYLTPTGSPTLAFYDQGNNEKWISASDPSSVIPAAFASASYDAIVFDGTSGLTMIKAKEREYKLAKWINEGSFYVVSTKHAKEDKVDENSKPTIDAFVNTGNASKAFRDLAKNFWKWGEYGDGTTEDAKITYEVGVGDVRTHLLGSNPDAYDYYVVAEPVLTAVKSAYATQGKTLNVIYDLQEQFALAHDGAHLPAAAIFVSNASYASKKNDLDAWLDETQERIDNAKNNATLAVNAMKEFEEAGGDSQTRFGITSTLVNGLQVSGNNKLAFLDSNDVKDNKAIANDFNVALGGAKFDDSLFL